MNIELREPVIIWAAMLGFILPGLAFLLLIARAITVAEFVMVLELTGVMVVGLVLFSLKITR